MGTAPRCFPSASQRQPWSLPVCATHSGENSRSGGTQSHRLYYILSWGGTTSELKGLLPCKDSTRLHSYAILCLMLFTQPQANGRPGHGPPQHTQSWANSKILKQNFTFSHMMLLFLWDKNG